MITIFSIPKPFAGHIGLIQRNALASWRRLAPDVSVILFGRDHGVAEAAAEFGAGHVADFPANFYGTPLVSAAFQLATAHATTPFVMYANADMLFDESLLHGVRSVAGLPQFLLSGRRWDCDITQSLVGADDATWAAVFAQRAQCGRLHGPAGMDFFVFPRSLAVPMPEFAVGRVGWDGWLVWKCRMEGILVVDATGTVSAVHQNHDYSQLKLGYQHRRGPERDLNIRAAGGLSHLLTLREADRHLVDGQLVRPPWPQCVCALLGPNFLYQNALAFKRALD